jgi:drug/metabolite transporter (DMT)-like permease
MSKLLCILLVALVLEAIGVIFLKKGIQQVGDVQRISVSEIARVIKSGVTNKFVLTGVFFEAVFFGMLLVLMSKGDISMIWPLTALGFVITTLAAKVVLHEQVSATRWSGVVLIVLGAALISWSEQAPVKDPQSSSPVSADGK